MSARNRPIRPPVLIAFVVIYLLTERINWTLVILLAYTRGLEDDIGHFVPITAYLEQMLTLKPDQDDYVYAEDNYASYTAGLETVFQAYADSLGREAVTVPGAA